MNLFKILEIILRGQDIFIYMVKPGVKRLRVLMTIP